MNYISQAVFFVAGDGQVTGNHWIYSTNREAKQRSFIVYYIQPLKITKMPSQAGIFFVYHVQPQFNKLGDKLN